MNEISVSYAECIVSLVEQLERELCGYLNARCSTSYSTNHFPSCSEEIKFREWKWEWKAKLPSDVTVAFPNGSRR